MQITIELPDDILQEIYFLLLEVARAEGCNLESTEEREQENLLK
jgi:hypothetical protein